MPDLVADKVEVVLRLAPRTVELLQRANADYPHLLETMAERMAPALCGVGHKYRVHPWQRRTKDVPPLPGDR
jgi:hypothetical protein